MANCEDLLNEFLERFPLDSLENISIEDYVLGGSEDNFCYCLEFKMDAIGGIGGGTAFKHGIYKKNKSIENPKTSWSQDDTFAWFSKYGNTAQEAFEKIREIIYSIAIAARNGNYKEIENINFSRTVKMKIAFIYSNKNLINIFNQDAINYLCKTHGISTDLDLVEKSHQLALLVDKNNFWDSGFWEEWANSDECKKQQSKSYWVCGFNFGGDNSQYNRFIKDSIWIGGFDEQKDKKQIEDCKKVKPGDSIILKSSYTSGENHSISTIKLFAIGIVKSTKEVEKEEGKIRFTFDVDYTPIEPRKEFKNCSYRKTIEQIRNDDLRKFINNFLGISRGEIMGNKLLNECKSLLLANHNIILHGAPGTGKTHLAKEIANAMGADVGFVQFHPSYDYTDFVEGLRPKNGKDGQIGFERKDGVFKEFCGKAIKNIIEARKSQEEIKLEKSWEDRINEFLNFAIDNQTQYQTSGRKNDFSIINVRNDMIDILIPQNEKTSELSLNLSVIRELLQADVAKNQVSEIRNFYQRPHNRQEDSYIFTITNEIRKIKSQSNNIASKEDVKTERKNFVFIIDEINRGEISKIFGELFFSIDPGYRGEKGLVQTQYQNLIEEGDVFKKGFFVPENVYIIGTMNDIDRSVESMDFAMRRRFVFKEITAAKSAENMNLDDEAKRRMTALNDEISKIDGLTSSFHIGAAHFLKNGVSISEKEDFDELWDLRLESLLTEYLRGTGNEGKIDDLRKSYGKEEE